MFFYSSNNKFPSQLTMHKLSRTDQAWIKQAAMWTEEKWGYIKGFIGAEERENLIKDLTNPPHAFYVFTYGNQMVGMCALRSWANKEFCKELKHLGNVLELDYVYIEESFRGVGVGSQIIEKAKKEAKDAGAKMIVLDTLDPILNNFYKRRGAEVVCESQYNGFPTEKMTITL